MKNKIFVYPIIFFIKIYQLIISPLLGQNCRYLPTCSEYTKESLKTHGLIKGSYFAIKRISSCHPFGGHGYDPIPKKKIKYYE
tara:strand:- start:34 stop:282 length:249 start_codon:yes stop_codon:yes gene_type:complete